ncbi:hypothetical protein ACFXKC_56555 [Streptomyces sp. NPDC059340]|uniref:DUF7919 family protein n=1 Tax=Streptomyces sp. NPDC059340 TaxID=3346806 RepID=UPI0036C2F74F
MTYYEDMSPYEYFPDSVPDGQKALAVGWLEGGQGYATGAVPEAFLRSLGLLVRDERQMQTRGWHSCTLSSEGSPCEYPVVINIQESMEFLGGAEIRVVAESGDWLIAPDLIYHYVLDHSYRPPQAFIEAVESHRIAPPIDAP